MADISLFISVLLFLLPHFIYGELGLHCECTCQCNGTSTDTLFYHALPQLNDEDYYIPECNEKNPEESKRAQFEEFELCCWEDDYTIGCNHGPPDKQCSECTDKSPTACSCLFVEDDNGYSTKIILGIGIGVGLGIAVVFAAIVGTMFYCRIAGRREGRQEEQKNRTPMCTRPDNPNRSEDSEYAEICDQPGRHINAVSNQGYDVGMEIKSHPYQSLKKPSQDMGTSDYMDPEKYTEPPRLPNRNSAIIENQQEEEDDYISKGTPPQSPQRSKTNSKSSIKSTTSSHDYAINDNATKSHDSKRSSLQSHASSHDYAINDYAIESHDSIKSHDSVRSHDSHQSHDSVKSHDSNTSSIKSQDSIQSNEYTSTEHNHDIGKQSSSPNKPEYVNVDDPSLGDKSKSSDEKDSDYVAM